MADKDKANTGIRKTWDTAEFAEKARKRDEELREKAKEAEEYLKKGKKPPRRKDDLPKPTELMKARETPLELDKNLNQTILIAANAGRSSQPGFFCEVCNRLCKDSVGYLDHINGRNHLRRLGQTTQVKRSTLADVKAKIAQLRAQTSEATTAKKYDFKRRLEEIKAEEEATKKARKEAKKAKKEEERKKALGIDEAGGGNKEMEEMMGFASWGAAKGK